MAMTNYDRYILANGNNGFTVGNHVSLRITLGTYQGFDLHVTVILESRSLQMTMADIGLFNCKYLHLLALLDATFKLASGTLNYHEGLFHSSGQRPPSRCVRARVR